MVVQTEIGSECKSRSLNTLIPWLEWEKSPLVSDKPRAVAVYSGNKQRSLCPLGTPWHSTYR